MKRKELTRDETTDLLLYYGIVSKEALNQVINMYGFTMDVLNDILFTVTGCRDAEEFILAIDGDNHYNFNKNKKEKESEWKHIWKSVIYI